MSTPKPTRADDARTFAVTTSVADTHEVRTYTLEALPDGLKPLTYLLQESEFISLEFTIGQAHFAIKPARDDAPHYCVACGEPILRLDGGSSLTCLDCYVLARHQGRINSEGQPIVIGHYCFVCGEAIGDVQGVPFGERIYCVKHRKD